MESNSEKLLDVIIEESQRLLSRLVNDLENITDDEIAEIEKLVLSRQESIRSLFTNHSLDELAPLSLKLQEMSVQDGKIIQQASTLKGLFSQKIISLKKNKKAVKSYSQF